jgi:hypothetical protein
MKKLYLLLCLFALSMQAMAQNPSVAVSIDSVTPLAITATFTPNEACASYVYVISTQEEMQAWAAAFGTTIETLVPMWGITTNGVTSYTWTDMAPATEYTIYVIPYAADNTAGTMVTAPVTTQVLGDEGISVVEMEVVVLSDSTVLTKTTPNSSTAVYKYGLITKQLYDSLGSAIDSFLIDYWENYDLHNAYLYEEWTWEDLHDVNYYACARGKNANGEWGTLTIFPFSTATGIADNKQDVRIYPNPAGDYFKIEGETVKKVEIFSLAGQRVAAYNALGGHVTVPVSGYAPGVYMVRINDTAVRKVVVQ